jgi:hypothetical protein
VVIWYIFLRFGILDQEKSGNPAADAMATAAAITKGRFLQSCVKNGEFVFGIWKRENNLLSVLARILF